MAKISVGILGATGMVGQRLLQLLDGHPWFEVTWLAASDRSAGRAYGDVVRWKLASELPQGPAGLVVEDAVPQRWKNRPPTVVFASLDSTVAVQLEPAYVDAGCALISNSSALRMIEDVPLLIPEINAGHVELVRRQRSFATNGGFAVTNPNCSATGLAMALAPVHREFGIEKVFVATMQAVSGAGYPGVASLDILGNVVPFIGGEEGKLESEPHKILGTLNDGHIVPASFRLSAHCNRVPTLDGHLETVSVEFARKPSLDELRAAFADFRGEPQQLQLPSAPAQPIIVRDEADRPQPRLDRDVENGMASVVGRIRTCPVLDYKFIVLGHNTLRGAAGGTLLNAELLVAKELL